jgi:hypothetical protein
MGRAMMNMLTEKRKKESKWNPDVLKNIAGISDKDIEEMKEHGAEDAIIFYELIDYYYKGGRLLDDDDMQYIYFEAPDSSETVFGVIERGNIQSISHRKLALAMMHYHEFGQFPRYLTVTARLHQILMRSLMSVIRDTTSSKANRDREFMILQRWPFSAVNHNAYGIHEAGYIPLITLMLAQKVTSVKKEAPRSTWSVAFFFRQDIAIQDTRLPSNVKNDIKAYYKSLDPNVTRAILSFGVLMGADYGGMSHVLNVLIVRSGADKKPFLTLLDRTWFDTGHNEYHQYYVNFMINIAKALGFSAPIRMALPRICRTWMTKHDGSLKDPDEDDDIWLKNDEIEVMGYLSPIVTHQGEWLSLAVQSRIQFEDDSSQALICPYHSAIFMLSCILEHWFDSDELIAIKEDTRRLIYQINQTILTSVLAGGFTLTPVAVQKALSDLSGPGSATANYVHVIDNLNSPPSQVYMWSIAHSRKALETQSKTSTVPDLDNDPTHTPDSSTPDDTDKAEIIAKFRTFEPKLVIRTLRQSPGTEENSDTTTFTWTTSKHSGYDYSKASSKSIRPLLEKLQEEAKNDTESKRIRDSDITDKKPKRIRDNDKTDKKPKKLRGGDNTFKAQLHILNERLEVLLLNNNSIPPS